MGKYFGTDGFRGEAGITLTADHAYKVGRFLGWYYNALRERNGNNEPARIVIGKDTRRSSYMFEYSLFAGLPASGSDAYLLHVTTTPSVAYIARVDDFDCGINGVKVNIWPVLMPVPTVSFATRYLHTSAGVMVTASHNPSKYNGYKVYGADGCQITTEAAAEILAEIEKLDIFADVKTSDFEAGVANGSIQ